MLWFVVNLPVKAVNFWYIQISTRTTNARVFHKELECGPMPNVMVALPNIGGVAPSVQCRSLADAHY